MKKLIFFTLIALLHIPNSHAEWNGKIFRVPTKQEISRTEFLLDLSLANIIVLGEKHYTQRIQTEEGNIISDLVAFTNMENQFSLTWEFLNASAQEETQSLFRQVANHEITSSDFLFKTQGVGNSSVYSPLIDAVANLGGQLFGGNLSRAEKAPVIKGGISALDPTLLPPGFQLGGTNYLERFTETMREHATPDQITKYFDAQCLVDDVMAYHLLRDSEFTLKFLVIGAFHSMYNDGVVARLKERDKISKIFNIEIIDSSDYTANEIKNVLTSERYGDNSDFIVFVNEPAN